MSIIDPVALLNQVALAAKTVPVVEHESGAPIWVALGSTIFAALAAGASAVSVWLNRRQWLASQEPFLLLQLGIEASGERVLNILNAGPSSARGLRFCVAAGEEFAAGYAGPQFGGYLAPGERAELVLGLTAEGKEKMRAVAVCWDGAGRIQRFNDGGEREILRPSKSSAEVASDPEAAFRSVFGDNSLQGLRRVEGRGRKVPR
jgi:hypothetical protein